MSGHGFEYRRHGTLSLCAALNPQTGEVIWQTAARHTSQEFVCFSEEVLATQPAGREIHVVFGIMLKAHDALDVIGGWSATVNFV